jgi:nitrile hydratase beta subunit
MNGIHDMGGMQGLGEIGYRENESGFHEVWEVRLFAMVRALRTGSLRTGIERIPASDYLRMSYYERWYTAFTARIIDRGFVTRAEVDSGLADPAAEKATPVLMPDMVSDYLSITPKEERDIELTPRFRIGERVSGRNMNPATHTRMPRYTRGKTGVVERDRGIFDLPDNVQASGEPKPQHVYMVRFTGQELWGEEAPSNDSVYIDMWEDYLEPA